MKLKMYGHIVARNYRLVKEIGRGSFGQIYQAVNIQRETEKLAVKLEPRPTTHPQLQLYAKIYKLLNQLPVYGFPKVCRLCMQMHGFIPENGFNVMLLDLLGRSLEDYLQSFPKGLSLKTVWLLAEQIFTRVELLHSKGFVHRDIKPYNLLMGLGETYHILHMIDLGMAKRYSIDGTIIINFGVHVPFCDGKDPVGTMRFMSLNTHMGVEPSRRDDIETCLYVMVYLARGSLPWSTIKCAYKERCKMTYERKVSLSPEYICAGLPVYFLRILVHARNLKFYEYPDYKYIKQLLENIRQKYGFTRDYVYDWSPSKVKTTETNRVETIKIDSQDERLKGSKEGRRTGTSMDIYRSSYGRNRFNFIGGNKKREVSNNHMSLYKDDSKPYNQLKTFLDKSPVRVSSGGNTFGRSYKY